MKRIILAFVLFVLTAAGAAADTIYLRDGRVVRGTVVGFIGGRFAVRVTPTPQPTGAGASEGEIQFFRAREVERVEIEGRSLDEARFETRTVEVSLGPNWIDSGLDLRRDERVSVTANGTIVAGRSRITPGGLRSTDPTAPLPRSAEGVLIGAIGDDPNAPVVEIGLSREFVADRDGRLYLTVNRGRFDDARGSFTAQVRRERDFGPRRGGGGGAGGQRRTDDEDDDSIFEPSRRGPARTRPRSRSSQTGDPVDNPSGPDDRRQRELTVRVPGNSQGLDTGLELRNGDQVTINAEGTIVAGQRVGSVNANGRQSGGFGNIRYPFPQAGAGALLGVVRDTSGRQSQPFLVGTQLTFTAQSDGRLFLLINDDNYGDNSGEFVVRIRLN
jgi:hypothetical protein